MGKRPARVDRHIARTVRSNELNLHSMYFGNASIESGNGVDALLNGEADAPDLPDEFRARLPCRSWIQRVTRARRLPGSAELCSQRLC